MSKFQETAFNIGLLWLRALAGLGIAHHGYGKLFGPDISRFAEGVASMGFPLPLLFAWAAILSEFLGGICIALGLFARPAALFVFITMAVAAFIKHGADPFQKKELALAYLTMAGAVIFLGSGKYSLGSLLKKSHKKIREK